MRRLLSILIAIIALTSVFGAVKTAPTAAGAELATVTVSATGNDLSAKIKTAYYDYRAQHSDYWLFQFFDKITNVLGAKIGGGIEAVVMVIISVITVLIAIAIFGMISKIISTIVLLFK